MTSLKLNLQMCWIYVLTFSKKSCPTKRWSSRLALGQGNTQHLYIKPYNITKYSQTPQSAIIQAWWHSSQLLLLPLHFRLCLFFQRLGRGSFDETLFKPTNTGNFTLFWQLHSSVMRCSTAADYSTICQHHILVRLNSQHWTAHRHLFTDKGFLFLDQTWHMSIPCEQYHFPLSAECKSTFSPNFLIQITELQKLNF